MCHSSQGGCSEAVVLSLGIALDTGANRQTDVTAALSYQGSMFGRRQIRGNCAGCAVEFPSLFLFGQSYPQIITRWLDWVGPTREERTKSGGPSARIVELLTSAVAGRRARCWRVAPSHQGLPRFSMTTVTLRKRSHWPMAIPPPRWSPWLASRSAMRFSRPVHRCVGTVRWSRPLRLQAPADTLKPLPVVCPSGRCTALGSLSP